MRLCEARGWYEPDKSIESRIYCFGDEGGKGDTSATAASEDIGTPNVDLDPRSGPGRRDTSGDREAYEDRFGGISTRNFNIDRSQNFVDTADGRRVFGTPDQLQKSISDGRVTPADSDTAAFTGGFASPATFDQRLGAGDPLGMQQGRTTYFAPPGAGLPDDPAVPTATDSLAELQYARDLQTSLGRTLSPQQLQKSVADRRQQEIKDRAAESARALASFGLSDDVFEVDPVTGTAITQEVLDESRRKVQEATDQLFRTNFADAPFDDGTFLSDLSDTSIAEGIAQGRAQRNFNPGNLKFAGQPGATPDKDGFANFITPVAGTTALGAQISKDLRPKSEGGRELTLSQFGQKYAPDDSDYANKLSQFTGLSLDETVPFDRFGDVATAITRAEGGQTNVDFFSDLQERFDLARQTAPAPAADQGIASVVPQPDPQSLFSPEVAAAQQRRDSIAGMDDAGIAGMDDAGIASAQGVAQNPTAMTMAGVDRDRFTGIGSLTPDVPARTPEPDPIGQSIDRAISDFARTPLFGQTRETTPEGVVTDDFFLGSRDLVSQAPAFGASYSPAEQLRMQEGARTLPLLDIPDVGGIPLSFVGSAVSDLLKPGSAAYRALERGGTPLPNEQGQIAAVELDGIVYEVDFDPFGEKPPAVKQALERQRQRQEQQNQERGGDDPILPPLLPEDPMAEQEPEEYVGRDVIGGGTPTGYQPRDPLQISYTGLPTLAPVVLRPTFQSRAPFSPLFGNLGQPRRS